MAAIKITSGGKDRLDQAVNLIAPVFIDDPFIKYLLYSLSEEKRLAYHKSYIRTLLTAAALNKAQFDEANDWSSCAVWMPPGCRVDNPRTWIPSGFFEVIWTIGVGGARRMLAEYQLKSDAAKKKGLPGVKKYHYLFFIGTAVDKRSQGLSSALIKRYQDIATEGQIPIWLESTTENSRRIYSKLGFEIIETIILGKGVAGADGTKKKDGEGVPIWAMLWTPPKKQEP